LAAYTVDHFKHEESLMEASSYPDKAIHKKQHDDFVQEVLALMERVKNRDNESVNVVDVKNVIFNWLVDHVLGSDKIMANHYREYAK